jgi:hypothetical protein
MMQTELRECSRHDGVDVLEMLREIGPGENGFQNNAFSVKDEEFRDVIYRWIDVSRGIGLDRDSYPRPCTGCILMGSLSGIAKLRRYLFRQTEDIRRPYRLLYQAVRKG